MLRMLVFCLISFSAVSLSLRRRRDVYLLITFILLAYLVTLMPKLPKMLYWTLTTGGGYYNENLALEGGAQDWQDQRNVQAWMINGILGLPFMMSLYPTRRRHRVMAFAAFLALGAFAVLTFSRSAIFGIALMMMMGFFLRLKRQMEMAHSRIITVKTAKVFMAGVFIIAVLVVCFHDVGFVRSVVYRRDNPWIAGKISGRTQLYYDASMKGLEKPLFGIGGNGTDVYHTFWLGTLSERGFLYTGLWVLLFILFWKRHKMLVSGYRNSVNDLALIDGMFVCMCITVLNAVVDNTFKVPQLMMVLFAFRGIESFYFANLKRNPVMRRRVLPRDRF